ncbi:MAG TPA: SCO family protein [Steroidobacteraceae bacterium]|nr:SCO family protein [Steroidobacteraceae bacterium]
MSHAARLSPLLACLLLSLTVLAGETAGLKAGVFNPPREAPDFSIRGSDGAALTLKHYRGKVVVLGFGYTSCPNVCPVTLAVLAQAHRKLGPLGSQVQVLYLTVDPERDNAERLKQYLAAFDPTFVGGTGTAAQMAAVRSSYGVTAEKHGTGSDYAVAHSSFVYLITRDGKLQALMPFGHKADDYVHDISMLLN